MNKYGWMVFGSILVSILALWVAGGQLIAPVLTNIGPPPANTPFEPVSFENVHGWYLPAPEANNCILLMHSLRSNRQEMIARAIFFQNEGFASLAIDLQAHGETPGKEITFGHQEANSARKAVTFLRNTKKCNKVIALGNSLGGAASLLGAEPLNVEGYILEAVYPGIEKAVQNRLRMRLGAIGDYIAPLLYQQIPIRLNIALAELQPALAIKQVKAPVLIMNGTEDLRTTKGDALRLFDNAPVPKTLVWMEGAKHTDLYDFDRAKYGKAVREFLLAIDGKRM